MARLNELTIRAALETAGVTRGVQQIIRELQRFEQAAASAMGGAAMPDVSADAVRAAEEAGQAYSNALVQSINSTRQNVADAAVTSITVVAQESAAALESAAAQAAASIREMDEAAGSGAAQREIRDWQDWADAVRESAAIAEEAARSQRDLASAQEEVARQTEFSADQIARWDAEQRARDEARAADEARRASATAQQRAAAEGAALRQQYEHDIAAIKEAQLRQLLTPEEAAEAARISAEAYNRELLQAIERGRGAGAFQGAEGQRVFTALAGDLRNVQQESQRASVGMSRLSYTMASLFRQATGTHPVIGQLANVVGSFALGSVVMVGVLAGLAALAAAVRHFGREAREAREELEDTLEALERIADQQRRASLGPGGFEMELARGAAAELENVYEQLEEVNRSIERSRQRHGDTWRVVDPEAAAMIAAQNRHTERAIELQRLAAAGFIQAHEEERRALQRAQSERQSNLASLIASGHASAEIVADARARIAEAQAEIDSLFSAPMGDEAIARAAALLQEIRQLEGAFESAAEARNRFARDAGRALEQEVSRLTEGRELRTLQQRDMGRILDLEREFARTLAAGNLSLEERNRLTRMLQEVEVFAPRVPEISGVDASIEIAGVTIANPDEMAEAFRRQVAERIERERIEAGLDLRLRATPRSDEREAARRAAAAAQEATQQFNETVQASNEMLSAFGDLADTAGALDEGLARALRGAQTFGEGIARLRTAENLRSQGQNLMGMIGMVSGGVSMAAGAIQIFAGIMESRGRAEREAQERLRQTTAALENFRRSLSEWDLTSEVVFGLMEIGDEVARRIAGQEATGLPLDRAQGAVALQLEEIARQFGLTMEDVERAAELMGIELYTAQGHMDWTAWEAVIEGAREAAAAMTGFADNLRGIQRERSIRDSLLGVERDAEQNLGALFSDLQELAPQLFERYFAGVDLTSVEDVRAATIRMFDAFAQEGNIEFAEMMRGMLPDDLISWFEQVGGALEDFESQIQSVADELRGVPQGFRILNLELARYNAMQIRTAEDLARQVERPLPTDPGRRDPVEEREREGGRDRPIINDHRVFNMTAIQREDEDTEAFAARVADILRRAEREDDLSGAPDRRYRPAVR